MTSRRWAKLGIAAVAVAATVLLLGFFAAPSIVRSQVQTRLGAALGRKVTLVGVRTNPFLLSAELRGLTIADPSAGSMLSCDRLLVDVRLLPWISGDYGFDALEVEGLRVRVARGRDGRLDVADIVQRLRSEESAVREQPHRPAVLSVGRLRVDGASFDWVDHTREPEFAKSFGPLRLAMDGFQTARDVDNPYAFSGTTSAGESFAWKGAVSIDPLESTGEVTFGNVSVPRYAAYLAEFLPFDLRGATVDARSTYRFAVAPAGTTFILEHLAATVKDVALAERGATDAAITASSIEIPSATYDVTAGKLDITSVAVRGGHAVVRIAPDGTINLARMFEPRAGEAAPAAAPSKPLLFTIGGVTVDGTTGRFENLQTVRPIGVDFDDVRIRSGAFSSDAQSAPEVEVALRFAGGGTVAAKGKIVLERLSGRARVTLDGTPLPPFDAYLADTYDLRLTSGTATGEGDVEFDFGNPAQAVFLYRGSLAVDGFSAVDAIRAEPFLRWKRLRLTGVDFNAAPQRLRVHEFSVEGPAVKAVFGENGRLNIAEVLRVPPAEAEPRPDEVEQPEVEAPNPALGRAGEAPALARPISIDTIRIAGGSVDFEDRTVSPHVAMSLGAIDATLKGVTSDAASRGDVDLRAKFDGVAPLKISGRLNPLNGGENSDFAVEAHAIDLLPVAPYFAKYLGHDLIKASLGLDLRWKIASRAIVSENVATFAPLVLGDKTASPDATKLPVKLGVALLRDRNGQVVLDVPVKGSLDDPKFKLRRVILRAVVNVFRKIVTSPFALLGRMFGGRPDADLSRITFAPGSASLDAGGTEAAAALAKALVERPALTLEITGLTDPGADGIALRAGALERDLATLKWKTLGPSAGASPEQTTIAPDERTRWIAALAAERFPGVAPTEDTEAKLLEAIVVDADALARLGADRARAVRDRILASGELDVARVLLAAPGTGPGGSATAAAMSLR